ncbi:MAG: GerMN domain-containing protein [Bacilli bacterium]|nr:GerMN domain-containing protein [Bacilli bacterium]
MIRRKALKKILITSIALFVFLTVYIIGCFDKENVMDVNLELEYVTGIGTHDIYLLNKNNYLVKSKILLTENSQEKEIEAILNNLIIHNNNSFPNELRGTIPRKTKILNINYDEEYVTINFSKEFLNVGLESEEKEIESIVYSLFSLKNIKGIFIQVEGKLLDRYPNSKNKIEYPLTKNIGINKVYNFDKRNDIHKVVVYYLEEIDNNNYYVPVTKYVNDNQDKIKVIIDSLTTNYIYEPNLMSFLNTDVKLNSYNKEENVFFLDFNSNLYDKNNKILEEVVYSISYSVFDNYDVLSIVFSVDGENVKTVSLSDLK